MPTGATPYAWLICAIVLEVFGTVSMKLSHGLERPAYTVAMFVFYTACFACMAVALKRLDVSVAYAVWSAVGTALVATIGVLWFNEPLTGLRLAGLGLVVSGVVVLQVSGMAH